MQDMSPIEQRQAFAVWLRTGRRPTIGEDGVERKFNPYHDPRNGRFTFAPGGPQSLSRVVIARRRVPYVKAEEVVGTAAPAAMTPSRSSAVDDTNNKSPAPGTSQVQVVKDGIATAIRAIDAAVESASHTISSAALDFRSLHEAIPSVRQAAAGTLLVVPESIFNQAEVTAETASRTATDIINGIRAYAPTLIDRLDVKDLIGDPVERLRDLRMWRAAAAARFLNDFAPMQLETLRLMQELADKAYAEVVSLIRTGKWKIHISEAMTIGNYVDAKVRKGLRAHYAKVDIDERRSPMIRVNRRELETTSNEVTFTRPDNRVSDIAYYTTIAAKNAKTPQVRRFFKADFAPKLVVIVRPRQLGTGHTYILTRPETKNDR